MSPIFQAIKDGNKVWATVKVGSNQDGSTTNPMTAPSGDQQLELLEQVYAACSFSPCDIQYIEAHGKQRHLHFNKFY